MKTEGHSDTEICPVGTHEDNSGDEPEKNKDNVDEELKQLSDLTMEELNKRTDQAIDESDREKTKELVAEISRRAMSPDPIVASARATNSHLRLKVASLEQEIKKLRKEIKRNANTESRNRSGETDAAVKKGTR